MDLQHRIDRRNPKQNGFALVGCELDALLDQWDCPGGVHGDGRPDPIGDPSDFLCQGALDTPRVDRVSRPKALCQLKSRCDPVDADDGFTASDLGAL